MGVFVPTKEHQQKLMRAWADEAAGLLDDPKGTNPEYERGLVELIMRVSSVCREEVEAAIWPPNV